MARKPARKAARLPSGKYAHRGRAVPFSKLPKSEQARFRSVWASKAATTVKRSAARPVKGGGGQRRPGANARTTERRAPGPSPSSERKAAREWLARRSKQIGGDPDKILATLGPSTVLALREVQKEAHRAYKGKGKRGRTRAGRIAEQVRSALGAELAAAMPQLWFYH